MVQFRRDLINNIDMMQREMNRLLDHFACSKVPMVRFSSAVWEPALDVYEIDSEVIVTVELAGVRESDIEIVINQRTFAICGERRKAVPGGRKGTYHQMEIIGGSFERHINLPAAVDATGARASYENGFLVIVLPKVKNERSIKVSIKTIKLQEK